LWASLVLAPLTLVARYVFHAGDVTLFALAALSLVPLAWLIGEATEHAGEHTGPTIGGFLNASFGNAPELIIVLFAVADGLPDVVRGSITGSIVSNILLVLGVAMAVGGDARERLDLRSLMLQLGLVMVAVLAYLVPAVPGWHGNPERHSVVVLSIPVSVALLALYVFTTVRNLRRGAASHDEEAEASAWSLRRSLAALAGATVATALVSATLVHSLTGFAHAAGLSEFFISAVIVAIVGNAAEHGGAIVIAMRGKMRLATEIAISSSAQVALFVTPAIVLLSFLVKPALPLAFRPIELASMGISAMFVAIVIRDAQSKRWEGFMLIGTYALFVVAVALAGDR
jgi:Ca2+:H+ antiporter